MKVLDKFGLTVLTVFLVILFISLLLNWFGSSYRGEYFELVYFLPGLVFTFAFVATQKGNARTSCVVLFIVSSTVLYSLVYLGSWVGFYVGICVIPSVGSILFLQLSNTFLKTNFSNRTILRSLLSGPISGGLTILTIYWKGEFGLIFFLPIIPWWIYMAVLIDLAPRFLPIEDEMEDILV